MIFYGHAVAFAGWVISRIRTPAGHCIFYLGLVIFLREPPQAGILVQP